MKTTLGLRTSAFALSSICALGALSAGCGDTFNYYVTPPAEGGASGTGGSPGTGGQGGETAGGQSGSGGEEPYLEGAPKPNSTVADLGADVFADGNHYWLAVDPAQLDLMNNQQQGGPFGGDIYSPGGSAATYANHLFVTSNAAAPRTSDFGKVEVRVFGQSTFRPFTPQTIPNLHIDTDEFGGAKVDGQEHLRFSNGQVGSIFRERIALEVFRRLGYPAPRSAFAWMGSNVWGPGVEIPYTLVESYKQSFCDDQSAALGGTCANLWEFVGDITGTDFSAPDNCQLASCSSTRVDELSNVLLNTPPGPGFKTATEPYIDWEMANKAQCLSWILWIGDDTFHNSNNVVLLERQDGKLIYLPYSTDISAGQEWYQFTPLYGSNLIAQGCQADPECWPAAITTCEETIAAFAALDPASIVDEVHQSLVDEGMMRPGDEERYQQIHDWYAQRVVDLLPELDQYRGMPCVDPNVKCGPNGDCVPIWDCHPACNPGEVQCGPGCALPGECFNCFWPWQACNDGSCQYFCP